MESNAPKVSPKTRSNIYVGCLIANVLAVVGFGFAALFGWLDTVDATAGLGIIVTAINLVSTGMAVKYRPTKAL